MLQSQISSQFIYMHIYFQLFLINLHYVCILVVQTLESWFLVIVPRRYCRRNVSVFVIVDCCIQNGIVNIFLPNSGDKTVEEEVLNLKQKLLCKILGCRLLLMFSLGKNIHIRKNAIKRSFVVQPSFFVECLIDDFPHLVFLFRKFNPTLQKIFFDPSRMFKIIPNAGIFFSMSQGKYSDIKIFHDENSLRTFETSS